LVTAGPVGEASLLLEGLVRLTLLLPLFDLDPLKLCVLSPSLFFGEGVVGSGRVSAPVKRGLVLFARRFELGQLSVRDCY
jgi:hypothetical protein